MSKSPKETLADADVTKFAREMIEGARKFISLGCARASAEMFAQLDNAVTSGAGVRLEIHLAPRMVLRAFAEGPQGDLVLFELFA